MIRYSRLASLSSLCRTRCRTSRRPLSVVAVYAVVAWAGLNVFLLRGWAEEQAPAAAPQASLVFENLDVLPGELIDSPHADRLLWRSPLFAAPLEVPLPALRSVYFPVAGVNEKPEAKHCFELAGGAVMFGTLVKLDDKQIEIDAVGFGRLHIDRAIVSRISRWSDSQLIYTGPAGSGGWNVTAGSGRWREDGGRLLTEEAGAILKRMFELPSAVQFEIELSWQKKADFDLALGVGDDAGSMMRAFRIEVWDDNLVAWRETDRDADVSPLMELAAGPGHIHFSVYLDQPRGQMLVYDERGKELAKLNVAAGDEKLRGGVMLSNRNGDLRLEHLRIGRWNGEIPRAIEADKARIVTADGSTIYGQVKSYDASRHEFAIEGSEGGRRLDDKQVLDVFLSLKGDDIEAAPLSANFASGVRVTGELLKIEDQELWLKSPGIREPIRAPIKLLYALNSADRASSQGPASSDGQTASAVKADPSAAPAASSEVRDGCLHCGDVSLHGSLVESTNDGASCLVWRPRLCTAGAALVPNFVGRIVYREQVVVEQSPPQAGNRGVAVFGAFIVGGVAAPPQNVPAASAVPAERHGSNANSPCVLHLRYGDYLPCEGVTIDDEGVRFKSSVTDTTFVRHERVQALELAPETPAGSIIREKKDRLLTLPRMQRDNPPTQLIRSIDGDYLRGRLTGMDEKNLFVEWRLETKTVPRERVARILWLHPEDVAGGTPPVAENSSPSAILVQALEAGGKRLTFVADRFAGTILSGHSEALGACRVDVNALDELLIGRAIEQEASKLAFHQWQLKPAAEPLEAPDGDAGDGGTEGVEHALVGKPAPDFTIKTVAGDEFHLADHKKSVVVLDFWASWCGPCLQTMPQVDEVAREFAEQGVELLAVNLEETPEQIKGALERLELDMPVGLDRDGRVAERYGATSIPQTVIVDREGKVARVYVGASARFDEQLRAALKSVIGPAPAAAEQPSD